MTSRDNIGRGHQQPGHVHAVCHPHFSAEENHILIWALCEDGWWILGTDFADHGYHSEGWRETVKDVNVVGSQHKEYDAIHRRACDLIHSAQLRSLTLAWDANRTGGGLQSDAPLTDTEVFLLSLHDADDALHDALVDTSTGHLTAAPSHPAQGRVKMKQFAKYGGFILLAFLLLLMASLWVHKTGSVNFIISGYQNCMTNLVQKDLIEHLKENTLEGYHPRINWDELQTRGLPRMEYEKSSALQLPRTDVNILTPWLAPIIWEGTYNYDIINEQFKLGNHSIGLVVFALKKYVKFLPEFLKTAELYFMVGHQVHYYVFTDRPEAVSNVTLKTNRFLHVVETETYKRWQDVSMQRMEIIHYQIKNQLYKEVDYLVCADSDMKFNDYVGVEILDELVATLHPGYYGTDRNSFPYERRKISEAYIPQDEGDFYYMAAFYAGTLQEIYKMTQICYEGIQKDRKNGTEAVWHEESHFNKYLVYHKPTKVLSPEYIWDNNMGDRAILKKKRFIAVPKNHDEIRN